jgi:hypothetical protein
MLRTLAVVVVAVLAFVLLLKLVGALIKLVAVLLVVGLILAAGWLVLGRR